MQFQYQSEPVVQFIIIWCHRPSPLGFSNFSLFKIDTKFERMVNGKNVINVSGTALENINLRCQKTLCELTRMWPSALSN